MLTGAFTGALGAQGIGSPFGGLVFGVAAALLLAVVQAILSVRVRANQLVVGIGFNILALGATTLSLPPDLRRPVARARSPRSARWSVPGLSRIPFLGPALFSQTGSCTWRLRWSLVTWWLVRAPRSGWRCARSARTRARPTRRA